VNELFREEISVFFALYAFAMLFIPAISLCHLYEVFRLVLRSLCCLSLALEFAYVLLEMVMASLAFIILSVALSFGLMSGNSKLLPVFLLFAFVCATVGAMRDIFSFSMSSAFFAS